MAKSSYSFRKRKKEIERKEKKEKKLRRKLDKNNIEQEIGPIQNQDGE